MSATTETKVATDTKETKTKELTAEMKVAQRLFSSVAVKSGESTWESIIHDKFIFKHPKFPSLNKKQFIEVHMALAAAFPDLDYGVNPDEWEQLTDNRKGLRATYRFTGTHTGASFTPFHDCPEIQVTHIRVALPDEHTIIIVEDGKIVEIDVDENNTLLSGPIGFYISIGGKMPRPAATPAPNVLTSPLASSAPASASFHASKITPSSPNKDSKDCRSSCNNNSSSATASVSATADMISHLTVDDDED